VDVRYRVGVRFFNMYLFILFHFLIMLKFFKKFLKIEEIPVYIQVLDAL
jgi:hypothetical protein